MSKRLEGGYLTARPTWSTAATPGVWTPEQQFARVYASGWPAASLLFDPYFESVSLLLHMDGSNGSTTFVDSSLGNLAVTANGNAQISTAQSKFGNASGLFDGNGDYLTASSPNLNADWTIEFWVYPTVASQQTIVSFNSGSFQGINFWMNASRQLVIDDGANAQSAFTGGTLTLNGWNHVACVRSGATTTAYINGASVGSNSFTPQSTTSVNVGRYNGGVNQYFFNGYLDEVRVTQGVARYTANFAVPGVGSDEGAALYDPYFDYVSLLLRCNGENNSTTFTDSSNNATAITRGGSAVISTAESRFGGSSVYFNGTNDSLSFSDPALGTSDFTIEMWFKTTSSVQYAQFIGNESTGYTLLINNTSATSGNIALYAPVGGLVCQTSGTSYRDDRWHHLALTRSGNNFTIWVDGVSSATGTNASSFSGQTNYVGRNNAFTPRNLIGYIDDLRITKGVCRYTTAFRPVGPYSTSGNLVDPYLTSTSLLLPMTGDNNTTSFFDRSNNFLRATENGNAKVSTAISKFGAGAAYFDGTGDYLSYAASTAFDVLSGDSTVEFWFKHNNPSDTIGSSIACVGQSNGYWQILIRNGSINLNSSPDGAVFNSYLVNQTLDTNWHHFAWTKQGSTHRLFYDGVLLSATGTAPTSTASNALYIAANYNGGTSGFNGYLDDFRITKGTARYISAFTPPERAFNDEAFNDPYYNAVSLLLHMDGTNNSTTFTDSSVNGLTVTANGDAKISTAQSRFGGASAVFDGTGDFLTASVNTLFEFSTGDFTVETWVYFSSTSGECPIVQLGRGALGGGSPINTAWSVRYNGGNLYFYRYADPTEVSYAFAWTPSQNIWYHIGIARVGTSLRAFVNGTQIGTTQTSSTNYNRVNSEDLYIGRIITGSGTFTFNGYIDELRITKGIARYTSNFTPPTLPFYNTTIPTTDSSFSSVSLLLHMDGSNGSATFTDSSVNALTVTANGNAQISTAQSKFGGASGLFDGAGDYLTTTTITPFEFGTGDFTVETWVYITSLGNYHGILDGRTSASFSNYVFGIYNVGGSLRLDQVNAGGAGTRLTGTSTSVSLNTWTHVAWVRQAGIISCYVGGTKDATTVTYSSSLNPASSTVLIGAVVDPQYLYGYIDDLRITKGVARYTSNFYIPRAAFPDA